MSKLEEAQKWNQDENSAYSFNCSINKFDQAITCFNQAIELDGGKILYHSNLAEVYFEKKDYQKCVEACDKAISVGRANRADSKLIAETLNRKAKALARKEYAERKARNLEEAKTSCEKALTEYQTTDRTTLSEPESLAKKKGKETYTCPVTSAQEKVKVNQLFTKEDFGIAVKHLNQLEQQMKARIKESCSDMLHVVNVYKLQMSKECLNSLVNTTACIGSNLESDVGKEIEGIRNRIFAQALNFPNNSIRPNSENDESSNEDSATLARILETRKKKSEETTSTPQSQSNSTSVLITSSLNKIAASTQYAGNTLALLMKKRRKRSNVISSILQSEVVNKSVKPPKEKTDRNMCKRDHRKNSVKNYANKEDKTICQGPIINQQRSITEENKDHSVASKKPVDIVASIKSKEIEPLLKKLHTSPEYHCYKDPDEAKAPNVPTGKLSVRITRLSTPYIPNGRRTGRSKEQAH